MPGMQLVGFAVALVLAVGCYGAPSRNAEARNALVNPHIVMGRDAEIEEFPYQISIESFRFHQCGGGIISENYVVTAAHCVDPKISGSTWSKKIRAGSTTSIPIFGWGGKTHNVAEVQYHPQWKLQTIDYDIGIIKVATPFVWDGRVQPIPVAPAGDNYLDYDRNATVSGWGLTSPGGAFTAWRLKTIDVPLVPRSKCSDLIQQVPRAPKITSRMLCVAGQGLGNICQGDSGGPLVHKGQVIGVASWVTLPCNNDRFPSMFGNILDPEIRGFIKQHTGV